MKLSHRLCAITCSLMLSSVAHAIPINYTYDNVNNFGASITGDFTANLTNIDIDQVFTDFTFTDGTSTISSIDGASVVFSRFYHA